MKKVTLIALLTATFLVGGCSQTSEESESGNASSEGVTQTQYAAPESGPELSPSDQAGLDKTQCLVEEAAADIPPEEYDAWSQELADEVMATDKDIATILEERGYSC